MVGSSSKTALSIGLAPTWSPAPTSAELPAPPAVAVRRSPTLRANWREPPAS